MAACLLSGCAPTPPDRAPRSGEATATAGASPTAGVTPTAGSTSPSPEPTVLPSKAGWLADVGAAVAPVGAYLDAHAGGAARPAIVLDIDNTSLETQYDPGTATPPVLALERRAIADGYSVLIVTARSSSPAFSLAQLRAAGYAPTEVCTRPSPTASLPASKLACRTRYTKAGYTIVANIGNRPTDFEGGLDGLVVKLPDYGGRLS